MSSEIPATTDLTAWSQLEDDDDLLLLNEDINLNTSLLRSDEKYVGFDNNVGDTWLYPSNFPERSYQYNIVQKALFQNTLVVLPTGLGKTFIAAVVMYNIYRWYPMGKVIFMAPTRPLVAQQIDACCKIMGVSKNDCVEITGKLNKAIRAQLWQSKRVFFATPQSVLSDITDGELSFPFEAVKLIVVDEAHRSKGRYAYTDVLSSIWKKNKYFRVLALSATPGRRKDDVEEVIRNLFISNLEVRTETSVDVLSYVHRREMKTVVVELEDRLSEIRDELLAIADPHIRNLVDNRLIAGKPGNISRNCLVMEHKRFRESLGNNRFPNQKELNSDFNISISVYHSIELLERHGIRVFLNNFDETKDGGTKFVVILRPDLRRLIERVRQEIGPNPFAFSDQCMVNGEIAEIPKNIDFGHPKFEIARDHVLAHFETNKDSRVIFFCEYRESVMLVHRLLLQHRPLIRPRVFVGQGGTGSIRAVTQQQQKKVMDDFRSGVSNALIATSVAEEGIDVGEVDLIVCFDINTSNPTRFIQRIGRTGRNKEGKVLLLATEGKEHTILKNVLAERNKLNKSISRHGEFESVFYKQSPRMVPTVFNPKCLKVFMTPTQDQAPKSKEKSRGKLQKFSKMVLQRDLKHFFKPTVVLDDEEKCIFETSEASRCSTTSKSTANRSSILNEIQAIMDLSSEASEATSQSTIKLNENRTIMDFSPPKQSDISKKSVREISKYIRASIKSQVIDAQKALTTNKLSKDSLKFLIDFSPDLLFSIWTRMQALWKKGINENYLPVKGICPEDRQTVRAYLQLIEVFGRKENIAATIESRCDNTTDYCFSKLIKKYDFIFHGVSIGSGNNFAFLMQKFEQMLALFPSDQHSEQNYVLSTVYDDEVDDIDGSFGRFNDNSHNSSYNRITESKYMSQWVTNNEDLNSSCEFPEETTSMHNKIERFDPIPIDASKEDSDDDVVFVGVVQQSTPLRSGSLKQCLLNFGETPIARKVSEGLFKKTKNINNNAAPPDPELVVKKDSRTPVGPSDEIHTDFFDDQFDAILAENCDIFEHIEKSNTFNPDSGTKSRYRQIAVKEKTITCTGSNESTSDHICSKGAERITSNSRIALDDSDSSLDDISHLLDDSSKRSGGSSTPDDIIPLVRTRNSGYGSNVLNSVSCQNVVTNAVHPEPENIDFNVFSDLLYDSSKRSGGSSTPDDIIPLARTRNSGYGSNVLNSASCQNVVTNAVHPELADIDFNVFSDLLDDSSKRSGGSSTPDDIIPLARTRNSGYGSNVLNSASCQNVVTNAVHPELADIDFNVFSDSLDDSSKRSGGSTTPDDIIPLVRTRNSGYGSNVLNSASCQNVATNAAHPEPAKIDFKVFSDLLDDSSKRSGGSSTPDYIIPLVRTRNSGYGSNVLNSVSCQNVVTNAVHPELADIDFNVFSETFSDDEAPAKLSLHRTNSPDLFEDLSEPMSETNVKQKSPVNLPPAQLSPCLVTKKTITWREVRLKYCKPPQIEAQKPQLDQQNDSDINVGSRIRSKRRLISSSSESSDDYSSPQRKSKSVSTDNEKVVRRVPIQNSHLHKKRNNEFIDHEAALSGSATEDELDETRGCYMMDSVVVHDDDVENDSSIAMTQMYLQSVRSPIGNRGGAFKIPPRRQFNDELKIFSQQVPEDNGSYITDSFVVSDVESDFEQSMCPLERAEAILKEKRRAKRKASMFCEPLKKTPKRKRVLRIHNSSEDDDDFE